MKIAITTRKVNLLAIDQEKPAKNVFSLPVDNHLREFTISISGEDPYIEIKDQNGENSVICIGWVDINFDTAS